MNTASPVQEALAGSGAINNKALSEFNGILIMAALKTSNFR